MSLDISGHLQKARTLIYAAEAEHAFASLSGRRAIVDQSDTANEKRRRILIPMIRAEIKRRDNARLALALGNELKRTDVCSAR